MAKDGKMKKNPVKYMKMLPFFLSLSLLFGGCASVSEDSARDFGALLAALKEGYKQNKIESKQNPNEKIIEPEGTEDPIEIRLEEIEPEPVPRPTPGPLSVKTKECDWIKNPNKNAELRFGDGKGGNLWKKSETRTGYVFLVSSIYGVANSVKLCNKDRCLGMHSDIGANPDWLPEGKLCRHHWRIELSDSQIFRMIGRSRQYQIKIDDKNPLIINGLEHRKD